MWWRIALLGLTVVALSGCAPASIATWELDGPVAADSTEIEILVTRAECSSGVTGKVLAPEIEYESDRILITAFVEPLEGSFHTCPDNDAVPLVVRLSEPVKDRELVDAYCLNPDVAGYAWCRESEGIRWPPPR